MMTLYPNMSRSANVDKNQKKDYYKRVITIYNKINNLKYMNKFIEEVLNILKKDKRLFSKDDNKLLKGELISLISKDDEKLLELLASDKEIEKRFFKKIGKITIFQKENFLQLITMNEFLPDSFTAFEVNIGLSNNKELVSSRENISLVFPHKDCILEGGQGEENEKREEIFYNTNLAPDEIDRLKEPKVLTNWKKFDSNGEHSITEVSKSDNLVIKGNNLLALYSLQQNFRNKIKLIYIDPPYNTGNDEFKYNDSFNHSAWLTFIKNRLEVAKELLCNKGVIFVQCDDHEQAYLKVLMDEIFGRDKFINCISVKMNESKGLKNAHIEKKLPKNKEFILVYAEDDFLFKPQQIKKDFKELQGYTKYYNKYIPNINDDISKWKINKFNFDDKEKLNYQNSLIYLVKPDNEIKVNIKPSHFAMTINNKNKKNYFYNDNGKILKVLFLGENLYRFLGDLWTDISTININKEGGIKVLSNGQKPEKLLKRIIEMSTDENDVVLDFFAGSGTTGAVSHKMNRRYILIEQMDYIHDLPEARLKNVIAGDQTGISRDVNWNGGGSFVYTELLEWNNKYIRDLESAKTKTDIKKIKAKIEKEAFYKYQINTSKFDDKEFDKLSEKEQKEVLIDVLDMNHLYVNLDSINDATFAVSKEDKELNKKFYNQK